MSQHQIIRIYDSNTKATCVSISAMVLALMFGIALMSAVLIMISVRANYACNTLTQPDIEDCNTGTTCLINIPTNSAVAQASSQRIQYDRH